MFVPPGLQQLKRLSEQSEYVIGVVPGDRKPAASVRTIRRKSRDDCETAGRDRAVRDAHVSLLLHVGRQKMKGGTIVPEGIFAIGPPPGDVRDDPVYPVCLCAKPIARRAETFRADIEDRQIPVTLFDQQIDQPRRTAADVDNGGVQRNPRRRYEFQGSLTFRLEPAHVAFAFGGEDVVPMRSIVSGCHD